MKLPFLMKLGFDIDPYEKLTELATAIAKKKLKDAESYQPKEEHNTVIKDLATDRRALNRFSR